jgi:hypothetical protein
MLKYSKPLFYAAAFQFDGHTVESVNFADKPSTDKATVIT